MEWLKYLFIPFLMSALLTPILKKIAYRLDIYAEMNERSRNLCVFYYHNGNVREGR